MNLEDQTDEALRDLVERATFELNVRWKMVQAAGLGPCQTIWGPGPPWYCVPRCKGGFQGHPGKCEPNMTQDEARDAYYASSNALFEGIRRVNAEAERRLG